MSSAPQPATTAPDEWMPPVLCLDWNGTVVDDDHRAWQASRRVLDELGAGTHRLGSLAEFRRVFTLPLGTFFAEIGVGPGELAAAVEQWNQVMAAAPAPRLTSGARELLAWANEIGVPVHVVSGADPQVVENDRRLLLPQHALTSITGHAHPKSDHIRRLTRAAGGVYVGDTTYDIEEGRRAGALTLGLAADQEKGVALAAANADHVISDLRAVIDIMASLISRAAPNDGPDDGPDDGRRDARRPT